MPAATRVAPKDYFTAEEWAPLAKKSAWKGPALIAHAWIVILGAGFAGLTAAKQLAKLAVDLTIVDQRNHHLFQPLLYQVATAGLSPADIATETV